MSKISSQRWLRKVTKTTEVAAIPSNKETGWMLYTTLTTQAVLLCGKSRQNLRKRGARLKRNASDRMKERIVNPLTNHIVNQVLQKIMTTNSLRSSWRSLWLWDTTLQPRLPNHDYSTELSSSYYARLHTACLWLLFWCFAKGNWGDDDAGNGNHRLRQTTTRISRLVVTSIAEAVFVDDQLFFRDSSVSPASTSTNTW